MDDWRIRITVEGGGSGGVLDRLGLALNGEAADLARELEQRRLAVSHDGDDVFVYATSYAEAARAREVIEAVLRDEGIAAETRPVEHWLEREERWDGDPAEETWEADELERGFAPWEVRVALPSHADARRLAEQLEQDGYSVERRWTYLIVGAASREDADALAARLHGEVEPGGELVWETVPGNPFAVFGGLGGSGTPAG
jgi:SPOR domain